jgi:diamine N-acetyltransferase
MMYILREIQKEDLDLINSWRNDREIVTTLGSPFRYIGKEVDEGWFKYYIANRSNNVRLAILKSGQLAPIGAVYLTSIDWVARSAEFSIWIGERSAQGQGAGYFATTGILKHAFKELGLNRVYLTALRDNIRACALYNKVGFKQEGILRQAAFKDGRYVDFVLMAIIASEFVC